MCGIAGQVALHPNRSPSQDQVLAMLRAMIHRGPDDEGVFADPTRRAVIGIRRLSIIDLVSGRQPIFNEDHSVACVLNGEIYNFLELRADLERRGHFFQTNSDTEAIVHLYEEEGVRCLQRLRGMFALAVWDARTGTLLVARDRLGKKPVYYTDTGGRLSFASELPVLRRLPDLARDLDSEALDLYLTYSYIPAPHSIYRSVRKLPAAHYLLVRQGQVEVEPYWRLDVSSPWDASREEIRRGVVEHLREAVRLRLISDVPLGCFLSGGTDSSVVVALMSELSNKPVKTFTIGFSYERFNELTYAREVANHFGTDHHEYVVEPDAVEILPQLARHFGEPFGDSSALPTWYVAKMARQHVTVALNGDGGDELFAGYPWYRTALALDRIASKSSALIPPLPFDWTARSGPAGRAARLAYRLRLDPGQRFASLRQFLLPAVKRVLYTERLMAGRGDAADAYLLDHYRRLGGDALTRYQATDILTYLPEDLLVKVDRMTMAHSLEGRSPILDHELVEFCMRIPWPMRLAQARGKAIFREAIQDRFPPGFLDRPKMGFSIPVAQWLRRELRGLCEARLRSGILADLGLLRPEGVRRLLDEHLEEARDWSAQLWNLLMLAEWAETA